MLPPVGFILGIVTMLRGKRIRGWVSDLSRAAIGVSLAMTVVIVVITSFTAISQAESARQLAEARAAQRAHAQLEAVSQPFCETVAQYPTIFGAADPDYGWPQLDAPEGYLPAIGDYADAWTAIAAVAPPGVAEDATAISTRVNGIVGIATALGTEQRSGDLLDLHQANDLATVQSWWIEYCPQP